MYHFLLLIVQYIVYVSEYILYKILYVLDGARVFSSLYKIIFLENQVETHVFSCLGVVYRGGLLLRK